MTGTVHIFSNGEEFRRWEAVNCDVCVKESWCDLLRDGIGMAFLGDGLFTQAAADRLGFTPDLKAALGWRCAEFSDDPAMRVKPAAREMREAGAPMLPGLEAIS